MIPAREHIINFMPAVRGLNLIEKVGAANSDIIQAIEKNYPQAVEMTRGVAETFKGHSAKQTAFNIWKFLKTEINYIPDPDEKQKIKLPNRFLSDAAGDCKSFALFTSGLLANLEMPVAFRFASYNFFNETPSHVYVVTKDEKGNEIIIDGVYKKFNSEKPYQYKRDKNMTVLTLSGFGENQSMQALKDYRDNLLSRYNSPVATFFEKQRIKKAIEQIHAYVKSMQDGSDSDNGDQYQAVGKVTGKGIFLAPSRNAFLSLVALNVRGLAHKLAFAIYKNEASTRSMWEKLGGDFSKLKGTVDKSKNKTPLFGEKNATFYNIPNGGLSTSSFTTSKPSPYSQSEVESNVVAFEDIKNEPRFSGWSYIDILLYIKNHPSEFPGMVIKGVGIMDGGASSVGVAIAAAAPVIAAVATFLSKLIGKNEDSDFSNLLDDAAKLGGNTNAPGDDDYIADAESGNIIPGVPNMITFGAGGLLVWKLLKII